MQLFIYYCYQQSEVFREAKVSRNLFNTFWIVDKINTRIKKQNAKSEEINATVLVKVKGFNQTIEVTISTTNFTIRNEVSSEDFNSVGINIMKNKAIVNSAVINDHYGKFKGRMYRILKDTSESGEGTSHSITAEFTIK